MRRSSTCFETVEIKFPSTTQTKIYLQDYPVLRNKVILRVFSADINFISKSPLNRALVSQAVALKTFLTLCLKGKEKVNRFPVCNLIANSSLYGNFYINDVIDFPKSFVEVGSATGLSASESIILIFEYYDQQYAHQVLSDKLRCENIELVITDITQQKFAWPDNENLRGMFIKNISYGPSLTYTPNGYAFINSTVENFTYVSLVKGGVEIINKIPLKLLGYSLQNDVRIDLANIQIDQTQCYFWVPTTTGLVANEAFFINVFYFDPADQAPRSIVSKKPARRNQ